MLNGKELQANRVLIDADAIFDTRIHFIYELFGKRGEELLVGGKYTARKSDQLSLVDSSFTKEDDIKFKEVYANRKIEDIRGNVTITLLCRKFREMCLARKRFRDIPTNTGVSFTINVYPYAFSEEEMRDLEDAFQGFIGFEEKVQCVSIPSSLLTPRYLKDHFDEWYTYDFDGWLNVQHEALAKLPMPNVAITFPASIVGYPEGDFDLDVAFLELKSQFAAVVTLGVLPLEAYSIDVDFIKDA